MTILTEEKHTAAFIVSEANGYRSRGTGVVNASSGALEAGTVMGKVTVSYTHLTLPTKA